MTEKTILVIDTDAETSQNIKTILESEGYAVYNSSGMSGSVSTALKIKPSLVFINIAMRDTSGLEIAKSIHESEQLRDVPIIIITPHGGTVEPRYTLMYGIVDFIKKSFTPEELISKTIDVTEMNSSGSSTAEKPVDEPPGEEPPSDPPAEEPVIRELHEEEIPFTETISRQPTDQEAFHEVLAEISTDAAPESGKEDKDDDEATWSVDLQDDTAKPDPLHSDDSTSKGEPEAAPQEPDDIQPEEEDVPDVTKEDSAKPKLATFILAVVLVIVAAGGGVYLYTRLSSKPETPKPAVSVPPAPQSNIPKNEQPPRETQVQPAEKVKPAEPVKTEEKILPVEPKKVQKQEAKGKPLPAKRAPAKGESKPFYSVQVGVFKNKGNAVSQVKHFAGMGYDTFSYETHGKGKGLYRVLIGRFDKRKEAEVLAGSIRSKENTGVIIFSSSGKKK